MHTELLSGLAAARSVQEPDHAFDDLTDSQARFAFCIAGSAIDEWIGFLDERIGWGITA